MEQTPMPHLFDTFHIGSFRGFTDVELKDCGAVNLLIGPNNSGKSTILEALALYADPFDAKEWLSIIRRRDDRGGRSILPDDIWWLFSQSSDRPHSAEIHLDASGSHPAKRLRCRANRMIRIGDRADGGTIEESGIAVQLELEFSVTSMKRTLEFWPRMVLQESEPSQLFVDLQSLTPFSHRIDPLQLKGLSEATQQGWKEDILVLLRQIDPAIEDLEILTPDGQTPGLHANYKGLGLAPLATLGDGLRRIISIALAIGNLKNGLLLIDEIESAVHVSALETVFPWLTAACKRNNVQLFATTHSLEALDALLFAPESEDMACFRLARPGEPERVRRLSADLLRRMRSERGLDIRLAR